MGVRVEKEVHHLSVVLTAVILLAAALLFGNYREVCAASKKQAAIQVRVDSKYKAALIREADGWYLRSADISMGKRKADERIAYLTVPKKKELSSGYYYFNKKGCIDSRKAFHQLNVTANGIRFNGKYYFGEQGGRLRLKSGWVTYKGNKYALNKKGKMYTSRWYGGHYLKANGQIARNMKTPDGTYVDCDGRRCEKEEMRLNRLKKTLQTMIKGYSGNWSVYVKNLKTGDYLCINDKAMYPASVIKLFVMESTYDRIRSGNLSLNSHIISCLNEMITVSDNESCNELVRQCGGGSFVTGCKNINKYLKKCGRRKTGIHHSLNPSSSPGVGDGGSNSSCVSDVAMLLEKIYNRKAVSKKYSDQMLKLMLNQTRRWKIPSGLPSGTKVANKTGETDSYQHDAAIVYGKKTDYVVVIFSNTDEYNGIHGIKQLTAKIHSYLN